MNEHQQPWAFTGFIKKIDNPDPKFDMHRREFEKGDAVECPKCKGYGGWRYSEGSTFMTCSCNQCHGWGFVKKGSSDETCMHEMRHTANLGRCYNQYTCIHCGKVENIDSSD